MEYNDEAETRLIELIRDLNDRHRESMKPFYDSLIKLQSLKISPKPFFITGEDAKRLGIKTLP